jgi:TrmH family RNA methyltransferase
MGSILSAAGGPVNLLTRPSNHYCAGRGSDVTLEIMITSLSNERVKHVRALQAQRRVREKEDCFVIEGLRLADDAANAGAGIEEVFYTDDFAHSQAGRMLLERLSALGARCAAVDGAVMAAISDTQTPQGVLAVVRLPDLRPPDSPSFALVVDRLGNPGNLGTVLRTAAAAAVPLVMLSPGTVDATNPKVVRGAMGAHFRLPIMHADWDEAERRLKGLVVFLAEARGGAFYDRIDWREPSAIIVGGEAHGASRQAIRLADARVTIPMPGDMESLNAAVAAGILLFEVVRQRTAGA